MAIAQHTQVVALALFNPQREAYLIVKRGQDQSGAGKWEFPGGKIESHEGPKQALAREISEELSLVFLTVILSTWHQIRIAIRTKLLICICTKLSAFKMI